MTNKQLNVVTGWAMALAVLLPFFICCAIYLASGPLHVAWSVP